MPLHFGYPSDLRTQVEEVLKTRCSELSEKELAGWPSFSLSSDPMTSCLLTVVESLKLTLCPFGTSPSLDVANSLTSSRFSTWNRTLGKRSMLGHSR